MKRARALVIVGLCVSVGSVGCGDAFGTTERSEASNAALEPAPTQSAAKFEVDFLTDMIDHHAMAVHMAEMCVEKAIHEELRALCQEMVSEQSAEIEDMQAWLSDWYGVSHEPMMSKQHEKHMAEMEALGGAEFEVAFMEMMIKHHASAIREGERCVKRAYHEELSDLCEGIMESQSEEIALMEEWLCEWYDRCGG